MNNGMSYNDVEQLKREIRARLGNAVNDIMNTANGIPKGASYGGLQQHMRMPQQGSAQRVQVQGRAQAQGGMPVQGRPQPMRSSNVPPQPMSSSMVPPQPMRSQDMTPQPMRAQNMRPQTAKGGVYFDKYDCGHEYPKMSMQQHIRAELDTDMRRKVDNLQYAVVMSEVLGEPVSRKRRKRRSVV